ncbi:hydrolase [Pseudofulvibacter geojedonensis]|uniref:Hydrolase n=1 Tax=Pseudofulvibacter geojedonensis TaxID=1123758 RepID=A0ABW3HZP4_9FLAO
MKKQIYLYLFLLTALILLFVIVNGKKEVTQYETKINKLEQTVETKSAKFKDTIDQLRIENIELGGFTLKEDAYSLEHLFKEGYDADKLEGLIQDQLIDLNSHPEGNPLIPYAGMHNDKMLINSVKMLNYKWVIADFSDGKHWGQVMLKCQYNEDKTISFTVLDSFLYPLDVL